MKKLDPIGHVLNGLLWTRDEGSARMRGIDASVTPTHGKTNMPRESFTGDSRSPITFDPDGSIVDEPT